MSRNALAAVALLLTLSGLTPFAIQGRDSGKDSGQEKVKTQAANTAANTAPTVGKKAPRFKLNDHLGKIVRIGGRSRSKTWTVLAFYPKAGTPG